MTENTRFFEPTRRSFVKGVAWAAPVIAASVAMPLAAASDEEGGPTPNDGANYYWDSSAEAGFITLHAAEGGNRAQFSTQISYQSAPWVNPPAAGILAVTVVFSEPVTVSNVGSSFELQSDPGPATSFTFYYSPSSFGAGLTFDAVAANSGPVTATATMSVLNNERSDGSFATWAEEPGVATADVVA
ncbi:hypothetical protein [Microbacterium sp. YY-01]|uniref:hypothetical protein n=1 Tax=Microbacterium sp. YY-01 TaxID=3421634 RepID=UPI003D175D4F